MFLRFAFKSEGVPNHACIHTIDSQKLATKIQNKLKELNRTVQALIEVRTSDEESFYQVVLRLSYIFFLGKVGGVTPDGVVPLINFILTSCPNIHFVGLMTIEEPDNFTCFDVCTL